MSCEHIFLYKILQSLYVVIIHTSSQGKVGIPELYITLLDSCYKVVGYENTDSTCESAI